MSELKIEKRKIDELKEYQNNPREIEKAVPLVAESMRELGYITPIVVDEDNVILAGHTRLAALRELGEKRCDVIVASGMTKKQKRKYRILDNKTAELARWDAGKLSEELYDIDLSAFGYENINKKEKKVICPRCKCEVCE